MKKKIWERLRRGPQACTVQTARDSAHPFQALEQYTPLAGYNWRLYDSIREAVPLVDAAIYKIIRLMGSFHLECEDASLQGELTRLMKEIPVGAAGQGVAAFLSSYLEDMLVYGSGIGEMVISPERDRLAGLYNCHPKDVAVRQGETPLQAEIGIDGAGGFQKAPYQELLLFTPLNPASGEICGRSLLEGLPFVTDILLKIYQSIGKNFERVGNLRFAVTYKPSGGATDRAYAKEIAQNIAQQWQNAMSEAQNGVVKDFVAVGDVGIQVIGADNQMIDTQVPVRQMLEQITAKLGLPPFLLGLHWSTTERMSKQQTDILTSELEYYRELLTGVILKICHTHLALRGKWCEVQVVWDNINMQDEVDDAQARLLNAQAAALEKEEQQIG